jgi:hypothetical protein
MVKFGVSYVDAKNIAMDVFAENFTKLSHEAHRVAFERAEEFVANYLHELHSRNPTAIGNLQDPGIQSNILGAQSGFAKSGDQDLGEVLVDILVDRTGRTDRNITALSLSQALDVVQKLTTAQFAALSASFIFKELAAVGLSSHHDLYKRYLGYTHPFDGVLQTLTSSDLQYLAALGCMTVSASPFSIPQMLRSEYTGFFARGLDADVVTFIKDLVGTPLLRRSLRDASLWEFDALGEEILTEKLQGLGLADRKDLFLELSRNNLLSDEDILEEFGASDPMMRRLLSAYNDLGLPHYSNTAIGTAIGHANLRRETGGAFDTSVEVWIS